MTKKKPEPEEKPFNREPIPCKRLSLFEPRPEGIKDGWIIMNAPRPLIGNEEWEGAFHHGIFYAAIDPLVEEHTERILKYNVSMDGWVVDFDQRPVFEEWKKKQMAEYGISPEDIDEQIQESLEKQFLRETFGVKSEV